MENLETHNSTETHHSTKDTYNSAAFLVWLVGVVRFAALQPRPGRSRQLLWLHNGQFQLSSSSGALFNFVLGAVKFFGCVSLGLVNIYGLDFTGSGRILLWLCFKN